MRTKVVIQVEKQQVVICDRCKKIISDSTHDGMGGVVFNGETLEIQRVQPDTWDVKGAGTVLPDETAFRIVRSARNDRVALFDYCLPCAQAAETLLKEWASQPEGQ